MKVFLPFLILFLVVYVVSATPEYGAKESRNCPFCHVSGDYTRLNERGKYYLQHNYSFEGFIEKPREIKSKGEELYVEYCEGCHGKKGENFNIAGQGSAAKDAIENGRMPPGTKLDLSENDLNELVAYIDSLGDQTSVKESSESEVSYESLGFHMPTWDVGTMVVLILFATMFFVRYWRL